MKNPFRELKQERSQEKIRRQKKGRAIGDAYYQPTYKIGKKTVHLIGVIWHFGYGGLATGGSANVLTPHVGDANTMIPEYKAFLCDVKKEVI